MPDTVVVSVNYDRQERDFELPCTIKLKDLYPRFTAVMKRIDPMSFSATKSVCFRSDCIWLKNPDLSLADYGILTGAKLELIREG